MDPELKAELDILSKKIDAVHASAEKTRKYFLWTLIISLALFVLPLLIFMFAAPAFITSYTSTLNEIGGGI